MDFPYETFRKGLFLRLLPLLKSDLFLPRGFDIGVFVPELPGGTGFDVKFRFNSKPTLQR